MRTVEGNNQEHDIERWNPRLVSRVCWQESLCSGQEWQETGISHEVFHHIGSLEYRGELFGRSWPSRSAWRWTVSLFITCSIVAASLSNCNVWTRRCWGGPAPPWTQPTRSPCWTYFCRFLSLCNRSKMVSDKRKHPNWWSANMNVLHNQQPNHVNINNHNKEFPIKVDSFILFTCQCCSVFGASYRSLPRLRDIPPC